MHFASDNAAGIAPAILSALAQANEGFALAYGDDETTKRVERKFCTLFERDVAVFLVPTGTAANALAISHFAPPWGAVFCHAEAHVQVNECGAPEFFGGGLKLFGLPGVGCKIAPETLEDAISGNDWGGPHHVSPAVLSLTQATEGGTIYRHAELAQLSEIAHRHGMAVHVDGARFANALVRQNASPAEATWKAGVDVLSLGATKGGALAAEAVVFFNPARASAMHERRKRGGQLMSKHRFVAAQFEAFFADDLWLDFARHANRMADRLAAGLTGIGMPPVWPVEANLLFAAIPRAAHERLQAAGARYYVMHSDSLPPSLEVPADTKLIRLVCSFATRDDDIDRFVAIAAHA